MTPSSGLLNVDGQLFGMTGGGGAGQCSSFNLGCGTIFTVGAKSGSFETVYSFGTGSSPDGDGPSSGLIEVKGRVYGTTISGGNYNVCSGFGCGTVFSFDPKTQSETVLYSFCIQQNCADGSTPEGGVVELNGKLYGTTSYGGKNYYAGQGTLFSLDPDTGVETVVYDFCSRRKCADGAGPSNRLLNVNGTLYGTTVYGRCGNDECGVVYSFNPATGAEAVIHAFCSRKTPTDGCAPSSGLLDVNGTLYGTTFLGGAYGQGTVYSLDPKTGTEHVIYSFCSQAPCADGSRPAADLFHVSGKLYGTTSAGGSNGNNGTVFSIRLDTGAETVLHAFGNGADGSFPEAGVTHVDSAFFGTTVLGGTGCSGTGCGTVYMVKP